jgi:hypothetical protein
MSVLRGRQIARQLETDNVWLTACRSATSPISAQRRPGHTLDRDGKGGAGYRGQGDTGRGDGESDADHDGESEVGRRGRKGLGASGWQT